MCEPVDGFGRYVGRVGRSCITTQRYILGAVCERREDAGSRAPGDGPRVTKRGGKDWATLILLRPGSKQRASSWERRILFVELSLGRRRDALQCSTPGGRRDTLHSAGDETPLHGMTMTGSIDSDDKNARSKAGITQIQKEEKNREQQNGWGSFSFLFSFVQGGWNGVSFSLLTWVTAGGVFDFGGCWGYIGNGIMRETDSLEGTRKTV